MYETLCKIFDEVNKKLGITVLRLNGDKKMYYSNTSYINIVTIKEAIEAVEGASIAIGLGEDAVQLLSFIVSLADTGDFLPRDTLSVRVSDKRLVEMTGLRKADLMSLIDQLSSARLVADHVLPTVRRAPDGSAIELHIMDVSLLFSRTAELEWIAEAMARNDGMVDPIGTGPIALVPSVGFYPNMRSRPAPSATFDTRSGFSITMEKLMKTYKL